jgi:hypothetical protein
VVSLHGLCISSYLIHILKFNYPPKICWR